MSDKRHILSIAYIMLIEIQSLVSIIIALLRVKRSF